MKRSTARAIRDDDRRAQVRTRYGEIASGGTLPSGSTCCGDGAGSACCGRTTVSVQLGYAPEELESIPEGANLGLGCGNPTAIQSLRAGQTVLDLGTGAGIDCFLASKRVGPKGSVIGVDMTAGMLSRARENARRGGYKNVEFRLGEIEHLPVADDSVDVVISNCEINLSPEKGQVYREAFRVLRKGGHLAVADVVAMRPITEGEKADPSRWSSCSAGATEVRRVKGLLRRAGFTQIRLDLERPEPAPSTLDDQASLGVVPAYVRATKPRR